MPDTLAASVEGSAAPSTFHRRVLAPKRLRGAAIGYAAAALPATVLANGPIAERLGVEDGWIETRTGVSRRHVLLGHERLSDLAAEAGSLALERARMMPQDLDLLLVATTTQDEVMPNTAPLVAGRIGASNAATIDIGAACTAYVSALQVATAQLECGRARSVLVIGADALSRYLDMDDRRTAPLFGDGAGATVMSTTDVGRIGPVVLRSQEALEMLHIRRGEKLYMRGHETFANAVARLTEVTLEVMERAGVGVADVDLAVYHQANARIISAVAKQLGLPGERVLDCIAGYGNTSAASIPIALAQAEADGRLRSGMRVVIGAFGAGFTWGAALLEWGLDAT
ncbi:MAG: beta-ketoacyl-ACP synthase 3 [Solirubrobacteraceae bacterium]